MITNVVKCAASNRDTNKTAINNVGAIPQQPAPPADISCYNNNTKFIKINK